MYKNVLTSITTYVPMYVTGPAKINHLVTQKSSGLLKYISYHNLCSIYTNKLKCLPQMHNLEDLLQNENTPFKTDHEDNHEYLTRSNLCSHG